MAAISVLFAHFLGVFWSNREVVALITNTSSPLSIQKYPTPEYILWLTSIPNFDWGAYGVALFFIISGFVIPFSVKNRKWKGFLVARLFRIVPTYMFGFSITLLAILSSSIYFGLDWPFTMHEVVIHYFPGIRDLLYSRNIDQIVWTLEIELKFYLIVAICIYWFKQYSTKVFVVPMLLFLFSVFFSFNNIGVNSIIFQRMISLIQGLSQYVTFMYIGVAFHYLYCGKISRKLATILIFILFIMFSIEFKMGPFRDVWILTWSYGIALITFLFAYSYPKFFTSNPVSNFFANVSYPLYVIHGIAGYVALRIMFENNFSVLVSLVAVIVVALALSYLIHLFIELPTQKWGKNIAKTYFN